MEQFDDFAALTTSEAASLLNVHPSTVKRWCNEGELPYETTEGGHRRIRLDDAVAFARKQGIRTVLTPLAPYEPHTWKALREIEDRGSFDSLHRLAMGWVIAGDTRRLDHLFRVLGASSSLTFETFCDDAVRGLMRLVGDAWRDGRLRVGEEHVVSQVMVDVLQRLRSDWLDGRRDPYVAPGGPSAVVGAMEGNQHYLGALCVRLLLERLGWRVHYLGPDVPVDDFATMQRSHEARLVCISLGPAGTAGDVGRIVSLLEALYDPATPYAVYFGGTPPGEPPGEIAHPPFESVRVLDTCTALEEHLSSVSSPAAERR